MNNETKINKLKDLQNVKSSQLEKQKEFEIEDFTIEREEGKAVIVKINLKQGSFVRVSAGELVNYNEYFFHYMRDAHYYFSSIVDTCYTYLFEADDYKIEKDYE
jgi:hypothetical protein